VSARLDWEQRRAIVLARIARERDEIGVLVTRALRPVRRAEQAESAILRLLPLWLPLAAWLLLRPGRVLRWGGRFLGAYQTLRRVQRLVL
jgi:hypothetical protein